MAWQSAIVFALKEWQGGKERNPKLAWSNKYAYQERAWHSFYYFFPVPFFLVSWFVGGIFFFSSFWHTLDF